MLVLDQQPAETACLRERPELMVQLREQRLSVKDLERGPVLEQRLADHDLQPEKKVSAGNRIRGANGRSGIHMKSRLVQRQKS